MKKKTTVKEKEAKKMTETVVERKEKVIQKSRRCILSARKTNGGVICGTIILRPVKLRRLVEFKQILQTRGFKRFPKKPIIIC